VRTEPDPHLLRLALERARQNRHVEDVLRRRGAVGRNQTQVFRPHAHRHALTHVRSRRHTVCAQRAEGGGDLGGVLPAAGQFTFEKVRSAQEPRDPGGGRIAVEVARRAEGHDPPVADHRQPVGHRQRLVLVVRHVDAGDAMGALHAADFGPHLKAEFGVEVRERLVQEQVVRFDGQRTGQRHPLLLTAGELGRLAASEVGHLDDAEHLQRPPPPLAATHAAHPQAERHVVENGHVRPEGVVLEHHAAVAPVRRAAGGVGVAEEDPTAVRRIEPRDDTQQRRLAATRRTQKKKQFPRLDRQRHVVHRHDPPEPLRHMFQPQGNHRRPLPRECTSRAPPRQKGSRNLFCAAPCGPFGEKVPGTFLR